MDNKITKNLIILGAIIFSLILTNNVFADYNPYDSSNWLRPVTSSNRNNYYDDSDYNNYAQSGYNQYTTYNPNTDRPTVVNNYYYQAVPTSVSKTSTTNKVATTTSTKTSTNNTNVSKNDSVDSVNNSRDNGNEITALSLRGSGGFMPSSIWQWFLVIILILIIIVISRMLMHKKPAVAMQESHTAHAH
ncbi:MAG: hypothetical protein WC603_04070 [Candidatus Paceibacterota bacterium]|jgi:ATP-dependent Zn protease